MLNDRSRSVGDVEVLSAYGLRKLGMDPAFAGMTVDDEDGVWWRDGFGTAVQNRDGFGTAVQNWNCFGTAVQNWNCFGTVVQNWNCFGTAVQNLALA
jgi:hypothetical protein